jgi:hypothetical protein
VVASIGGLREIEDRIITPALQSHPPERGRLLPDLPQRPPGGFQWCAILDATGKQIARTEVRPTRALDFINNRNAIENTVEALIQTEGRKAGIDIREVRLLEPDLPPELLLPTKMVQLADQLTKAYDQQVIAQKSRVQSENAKATADQQGNLVSAQIEVQRQTQLAEAARVEGQGQRDKLTAIAEGQKAQALILGEENTVRLRQYELTLQTVSEFFTRNPGVLGDVMKNAGKFVPDRLFIISGGEGGGLNSAASILGDALSPKDKGGK